jgi:hypothetical protein
MSEVDDPKTKPARQKRLIDSSLDDRGSALIEVEREMWISISTEVRIEQLSLLDQRYHQLLDEIYDSANLCVDRHQSLSLSHSLWRKIVIVGTGTVAIVNILAAYKTSEAGHPRLFEYGSLIAAILAGTLAILVNLESFLNARERAQAYRESRELFLDVAREFDRRWDIYVRPLGDHPEACLNASELYRQLVAKDRELRAKFKELTKTESKRK